MTTILLKQDIRKKTPLHRMRKGLLLFAVPLLVAGVLLLKPGMLASRRSSLSGVLSLAAEPPIARILADYLLSEPIQAGRSSELHPEVLRTLKIGIYMVKKGDALSTIAQAFDLNMDTIISFNGIKSSRKLLAGSKLDIPNTDGLRYTVMRGDSLAKIAKSHDISLRELAKWNNLESETIIQGQELFVPGARLSTNELNLVLGKLFVYPTRGRLTSPFGYRKSPVTGMREFHQGIDIAGPAGTTIRAAMSGDVAAVGVAPIWGKYVILRHPDGYQTLYGHMRSISVSRGNRVEQGHKIGEMGSTGYSTGNHLHFTIFKDGSPVNPLEYLP